MSKNLRLKGHGLYSLLVLFGFLFAGFSAKAATQVQFGTPYPVTQAGANFTIETPSDGVLTVCLDYSLNGYGDLYNSSHQEVTMIGNGDYGDTGMLYSYDVTKGTYTFEAGGYGSGNVTFTFQASSGGGDEPGTIPDGWDAYTPNATYSVSGVASVKVAFIPEANGTLKITQMGGDYDSHLFDKEPTYDDEFGWRKNTPIPSDYKAANGGQELTYALRKGRTYFILAKIESSEKLTSLVTDWTPDAATENVIELDTPYSVNFNSPVYTFTPSESGILTVETSGYSGYIAAGQAQYFLYSSPSHADNTLVAPLEVGDGKEGFKVTFMVTGGENYYLYCDSFDSFTFTFSMDYGASATAKITRIEPTPGTAWDVTNFRYYMNIQASPAQLSAESIQYSYKNAAEVTVTGDVTGEMGGDTFRIPVDKLTTAIENGEAASDIQIIIKGLKADGTYVTLNEYEPGNSYVTVGENGDVTINYQAGKAISFTSSNIPNPFYQVYDASAPEVITLNFDGPVGSVEEIKLVEGRVVVGDTGGESEKNAVAFPTNKVSVSGNTITLSLAGMNFSSIKAGNVTLMGSAWGENGLMANFGGQEVMTEYFTLTEGTAPGQTVEPVKVVSITPANNTQVNADPTSDFSFTITFSGDVMIEKATYGQRGDGNLAFQAGTYQSSWTFSVPKAYIQQQVYGWDPSAGLSPAIFANVFAKDNDGNYITDRDGDFEDIVITYTLPDPTVAGAPFEVQTVATADGSLDNFNVSAPGFDFMDANDNVQWDDASSTYKNLFQSIEITGEGFKANATAYENGVVTFAPAITKSGSYTITLPYQAFSIGNQAAEGQEGDMTFNSQAKTVTFDVTINVADDFDFAKYTVTPDVEEPIKEFWGTTVTWGEYPVETVNLNNIYYIDPEWGDRQTAANNYLKVSTPDNSLVIDMPFDVPMTNSGTENADFTITLGKGSIKVNGELLDQDIQITYVLLPSGVVIPDPVSDPQKGMGHTSSLKTITITYPGFLMGGGMDLEFFGYDVTRIGGGARLYIGNNPYFVGANDSDYQEVSGITSKGVGASKQVSGRTWYESIEFTLPESYNDPKMWYTFLLNTGKLALLSEDNDIIEVSEEVVLSYQVADIVTVPAKFQQLEYDNYQGLLIKGDNLSVADASKVELYQMSFEALTSSGNAPADATLLGTGVEATNGEGILITVPDADLFTGGYTFVVRSGAINGVSQRVIPFSIVGRDMTIDNVKVTAEPEEGAVEEIESIKVYWGEEMPLSPRSGSVNATLNGASIEFNVVSVDGDIDGVYTSYLEYTPAQPITAAGTYNVVIPAGAVQVKLNSEYVSSNEVSLTYTIAATTLELPVPGTLAPPVQNEKYYYTPEEDCVIKIESKNKISFRNPYLNFFYTEDGTPVALKDSDIEASNTYGSGTWATYQLTGGQTYYFMSVRDGVENEDSFSFSIVSEGGDEPGEVPAVYLAHNTSWQALAPADDDLELTYDETSGMYKVAFDITEGGIYYAFYSKNSDGTYTNYGPANPTATWGNNADFTFASYGQTFTEYVKALSCDYSDWGMFRVLNDGIVKGNLLVTLDIPGNQMTATLNEEGTPEPGIEALYVAFGNTLSSVAPGANDPVLALQADGTYKGTFEYNLEGDKYFTVYSTTNGVNTYYATYCQWANEYEPITFRSGNPYTNSRFASTQDITLTDKFYVSDSTFEGEKVFNLTVTVDMDKAPNWTILGSVLPSTSDNVSFAITPAGAYSDVTLKVNDADVTLESDAYDYDGTYPGKVYFSVPDTKKITVTCNEDLVAGDDTYSIMEIGTTDVQVDLYEGAKGATFTVSVMDADAELPAARILAPLPNVDRVTSIIVVWGGSDFDENEVTKGSMQGMLTLPTGEEVNISNKAKLNQQWGEDGEGKILGDYYNSLLFQNLNLDFDSPFMGYDIQGTYTLNLPAGCVYVNGIPSEEVTLTFTVGEEVDYLTYAESIPESGTFVSALPFVALTWGEDVELVEEPATVEVRINGEVKGNAPVDILPSLVDGGIFSDGSAADYSCAVVDLGDFVDWNTTGVVTFTLPEGIVKNGEGAINRLQNFEYTVLAPSYADTWTPDPTETTSISNTKTISVSWGDATIEFNELATSNAVTALNEQTKQEVYFSEGNGLTFEDNAIVLDLSLIEEAGQYTFTVPANFVFVGNDKINVETMATYNVTIGEEEQKYFEGEVTIMDPETTIVASIGSVSVMWDMYYELTLTEGVKAQLYVSDSLNELGELVLDDVDLAVVNVTPQQEPGMEQIYPSDTWNLINGVVLSPDVFEIWGKTGTFTFVIPAGAVKNQEGLYNPRTEVVLHVIPLYDGNALITPECDSYGEPTKVKTLPDITITFDNVTNISLNEPCDIRVNIDGVHTTVSTEEYMTPIYDESDGSIVGYKFDINELTKDWEGQVEFILPEGAFIIETTDGGMYLNNEGNYTFITTESTGIANIVDAQDGKYVVYNMNGVLLLNTENAADLQLLQPGLYIINGKKLIIRK